MNKKQVEQYNMLHLINTHFDSHVTIWSSNVLISDTKTALSAKLDDISAAVTKQRNDSTGATMDKMALRKNLEAKAIIISRAICAYISLNPGQIQMYQTVFITKSRLSKLREADLLLYAENLDEAALSVIENLGPYGVSAATIAGLMGARTAFFYMMKTPREVTTNRKEATAAISVLLHQAIALLKDTMDNLVDVLIDSAPDFVNGYFNERRIHHIGSRTMSLEISTINATDNSPVAEAHIEVVGTKIKRISTKKGQNRVKNLKEGNYTLSVSHPDFVTQMIPITIIHGETTKVVVELGLRQAQAPQSPVVEPVETP